MGAAKRVKREGGANVKGDSLLTRRRADLVEAATDLILRNGFHASSVREIANAAGLTQANLYNYVRSKDEVLYLICREAVAGYTSDVLTALEKEDDPGLRLERAVEVMVQSMHRHRKKILIVYRESHSLQPESRKIIIEIAASFVTVITEIVADAQRAGRIPPSDPVIAANTIIHLATIFAVRGWSLRHSDTAEALQFLPRFILAGLRGTTTGPCLD